MVCTRALVVGVGVFFAHGAFANVPGTSTQLTTGSASATQNSPAVSGSNVVWTNFDPAGAGNFDIFFLDVAGSSPAVNLTNTPDEQEFLEDIDGGNVVFTHNGAATPGDIVVYDTAIGAAQTIAAGGASLHFEQPAIRGRYIVFLRVGAQTDVDGFDNVLGLPFAAQVTNDAAIQARPRVAGDFVVYEDYASGSSDVFASRISTSGPPFAVAATANDEVTPDIDGSTIVYVAHVGGSDQVFAYDLDTGAIRQLTTAVSTKVLPRISGSRVVWADDRNGNLDLYSYDLAANREEAVVVGPGDQFLSDIDGNRIVYTSNASGFEEVYLFTISAPPPPSLPFGCDPAKTDAVGPSVKMHTTAKAVFASQSFTTTSDKQYYVCVDNGLADGSERTAHFLFGVDGRVLLTPADFKPNANPPRHVAAPLFERGHNHDCEGDQGDDGREPWEDDDHDSQGHGHGGDQGGHQGQGQGKTGCGCDDHVWGAALFGPRPPLTATVTIRVAK
jgi:beta propeller repeat protein